MLFVSPESLIPFSRYSNFCLDFLVKQKNGLIRKIWLILEFMMSQPGKQTIIMHILTSTLRSWSVNRISYEKHFSWKIIDKMWGRNYYKTLSWKFKIEYICGYTNSLKSYTVCYNWVSKWGLTIYIDTKLKTTCFYII